MITRADVKRLIDAHDKIQRTLSAEVSFLKLSGHRANEQQLFDRIGPLIEQEQGVLKKLDLSGPKSDEVISQAYAALRMIDHQDDPSPDTLSNLHNRLAHARDLICSAARGPLKRLIEIVFTRKGALVLAGAAIATANVAIAVADQGTVSWVSLKVGYLVMKGDIEGIIKVLSGNGGAA